MPSTFRRLFRRQLTSAPKTNSKSAPIASSAGTWFEANRKRHPPVGLARDFLHNPEHLATVDPRFQPLLNEREVIAAIQRDQVPIPATADRENYFGEKHLSYWLSGLTDLRTVRRLVPQSSLAHVLDFGGATGRFARHAAQAEPDATVTIADLSHNHVLWCGENFGTAVRAVKVSQYCHFPLPDESVSLCVGFSVFTHIDTFETGWLAEIRRVLQPGSYAFLTIHSEDTWLQLAHTKSLSSLRQHPEFAELYQASPTMPAERLVFDHKPGTIFHCCNTFVHTDYVRRVWGKWFDILGIYPAAHHGFQTAVVLQKR